MDTHDTPTTQDKQITIAVPEDRVPEFYAFFGRFLAAESFGRRGRRRGPHGHGHGPGRGRCGHPGHHEQEHRAEAQVTPEAPTAPEAPAS